MSKRYVITHPDGRRYKVTPEVYERRYAAEGFAIHGYEPEPAQAGDEAVAGNLEPRTALDEMTVPKLRGLADDLGISLPSRARKDQIIDEIAGHVEAE